MVVPSKRRVLLLDTGFSARPIVESLLFRGCDVFILGRGGTTLMNPESKHYIDCDYADGDAVRAVLDEIDIDVLMPGVTDVGYETCARLAAEIGFTGLDSPQTTLELSNKESFRELCETLQLPAPRRLNPAEVHGLEAVIVKPVDGYSGRGISVLRGQEMVALDDAVTRAKIASRSSKYILEEFQSGQLYSHSCFLAEGMVLRDFIVKEYSVHNAFSVDTSYVVDNFDAGLLAQLREKVQFIASSLTLVNGLFHTQFILNEKGIWFVEVTRRCPGDLYAELIQRTTGFPYSDMYVSGFFGGDMVLAQSPTEPATGKIIRHTIKTAGRAGYSGIEFTRPLQIASLVPVAGLQAGPGVAGERIAVMFTESNSEQDFVAVLSDALNKKLYRA